MNRRGLQCALVILCGLASTSAVYAFGKGNAGTSGAVFLKMDPAARTAAIGDAFTGVADDLHSIYWNPAGLAHLTQPELLGTHTELFQSSLYEFAAFAFPTQEHGTWGMAISNLSTNNIDLRTEDTDASLGQFNANSFAYWLSYGSHVTSRLSLGANAKYIREVIGSAHANTLAGDVGALYDTDWHDIRLGASVRNFGTAIKFDSESDPLPLEFRLGASAPVVTKDLRVSSDLLAPRDHKMGVAVGAEYHRTLRDQLAFSIRTGYRSDTDVTGLSGLSAGGGLEFGRFGFDFAWVPYGVLGNSYQYSLHIKFGAAESRNVQTPKTNLQKPINLPSIE